MPHEAFVMARCMRARVCTPSAGVRCVSADGTCTGMALVVVTARRHHRHVTAGCIPIFRAPGTEVTIIFDNEPRNKEVCKQIEKTISQGRNVVIWPDSMKHKDINDMILAGYNKKDIQQIITDNTFQAASASLRFAEWRKINA